MQIGEMAPENANVLCEKILSCSPLIGHASIIDSDGRIIVEINRQTGGKASTIGKELQDNYGLLVSIISGVAEQAETPFGKMDYFLASYAKLKLAVISKNGVKILISLARHANIEEIAPLVEALIN